MMYSKTSLDYGDTDEDGEIHELIDVVCKMKNRLTHRGGFSAMHRVFGFTPAMPGDIIMHRNQEDNLTHNSQIEFGDVTIEKQARMRECAGRAFFASECSEVLRRAVYSGPRKVESYFWSVGQFRKVGVYNSATRRPNHAFWHGSCRVIATQYPSSIYISFQGRLVKAAPEAGDETESMETDDGQLFCIAINGFGSQSSEQIQPVQKVSRRKKDCCM